MKPSQNALKAIKNREQCRLTSYRLSGEAHYTIGWGHYCDSTPQLDRANAKITQAQADAFLMHDVTEKTKYIDTYLKIAVNQNLYDALVSTMYQYSPSNTSIKNIFRFINLGYPVSYIASMLLALPSNSYNKKARKVDSILATTGKVVYIDDVKV